MNIGVSEEIVYVLDKIICWNMMFSYCVLLKMIISIKSMMKKYHHAFLFGGKRGKEEFNITKFVGYHQDL